MLANRLNFLLTQRGVTAPFFLLVFALAGCTSNSPSYRSTPPAETLDTRAPRTAPPSSAIELDPDTDFPTAYFGVRTRTCYDIATQRRYAQLEAFLTLRPSPAEPFLRIGDRIVGYNGVAIRDAVQLSRAIEVTAPHTRSEFKVIRNGRTLVHQITGGSYVRAGRLAVRVPEYLPECR